MVSIAESIGKLAEAYKVLYANLFANNILLATLRCQISLSVKPCALVASLMLFVPHISTWWIRLSLMNSHSTELIIK